MSFPREGRLDPEAGMELARQVRWKDPDLPILLQSTETPSTAAGLKELGAVFLHKESPTLLADLRTFMLENFGFGDFVFRLPDRTEVARAADLRQLLAALDGVPDASLVPRQPQPLLPVVTRAHRVRPWPRRSSRCMVSHFPSIAGCGRYLGAAC